MSLRALLTLTVLLLLPQPTLAALLINEVAWMGSTDSANDEWIELYNNGSESVNVDGWLLTDNQSLQIELLGTIAAGKYAVLERTDDNSANGVAFQIYTGALSNTGATLSLRDQSGALVDQVAGGEDWELIGGDNVTKETAQLTSAGWVTALPTPGSKNSTVSVPEEPDTITNSSKTNASNASGKLAKPSKRPVAFVPSTKELQLAVDAPPVVYVNQPVQFTAAPNDIGKTIQNSLRYEWNFGDLSTAVGKSVTQTYEYPGEYLITVRAHYARHDTVLELPVTVLPVRFSLSQNSNGDVQVHNDSPYDINVSGFSVRGNGVVTFPPRSLIPQDGTVTIAKEKFGGTKLGQAYLYDSAGTMLAFFSSQPVERTAAARPVNRAPASASVSSPIIPEQFTFSQTALEEIATENTEEPVTEIAPETTAKAASSSFTASVITATPTTPDQVWPLAGVAGIILLGIASVYFGSQKS